MYIISPYIIIDSHESAIYFHIPTILGNILIHLNSLMPQTPVPTCTLLFVLSEMPFQVRIGAV